MRPPKTSGGEQSFFPFPTVQFNYGFDECLCFDFNLLFIRHAGSFSHDRFRSN